MKYMWGFAWVLYLAFTVAAFLTGQPSTVYAVGMIAILAMVRIHSLEDRLNALAKRETSQGSREQGRQSTSVSINVPVGKGSDPSRNAEYAHFHRNFRDGSYRTPIPANDCFDAQQGKGSHCIWRDAYYSWGDNIKSTQGRIYRYPERYS